MDPKLKDLSNAIRFLSIDAVQKANSGHPGMPMGMADVATVLLNTTCGLIQKILNGSIETDSFCLQDMDQCSYTRFYI